VRQTREAIAATARSSRCNARAALVEGLTENTWRNAQRQFDEAAELIGLDPSLRAVLDPLMPHYALLMPPVISGMLNTTAAVDPTRPTLIID